jgi:hypothetical protein
MKSDLWLRDWRLSDDSSAGDTQSGCGILEVTEESLLQEMTSHFIKGKIADSEQRMGKFYLPRQARE